MSQERNIILTNKALYSIKKKDLRRRISYKDIRGITYSKLTFEFVVHGNDDEYDYQYIHQDRNLIICFIAIFYQEVAYKPIQLCEVEEKTLKNYVTQKKEKKEIKIIKKEIKIMVMVMYQVVMIQILKLQKKMIKMITHYSKEEKKNKK